MKRSSKRGGRPSKFTAATKRRIMALAKRGLPLSLSAEAVGISRQTLSNWRQNYPPFEAALAKAIARGADARLRNIERAAKTDWKAACWLLEHCLPQHFARTRLEMSGPEGAPILALYLPKKNEPPPLDVTEVKTLTEGNTDAKEEDS